MGPLCDFTSILWISIPRPFVIETLPRHLAPPLLSTIFQSLNSKQRQLRKSGNELMPNDAVELQRVSTEQQALQKHLEAARKQARQHSMLMQVSYIGIPAKVGCYKTVR